MGFLDKLLGREPLQQQRTAPAPTGQPYQVPPPRGGASSEDERAIARYKYLLRTADPEHIERVHAEAFGKLSPEQRQMVLQRLTEDLPENERPRTDQPADLARSATRAEMSRPGYLQGAFGGGRGMGGGLGGGMGGGMGMGGMIAGSMLGTIAGVVVGSALADMMLDGYDSSPEAQEAGDASADSGDSGDSGDAGGDSGDSGGDAGGDAGGSDFGDTGGGDFGGGDFGGGDFGGGDFGGGDFGGF
ncbi:hypothetical protein [Terrabacter terrigena]|uniref:DUF2076 domain-containing protein n=1 Tax=Terrabacter terrigena TaxID=574718 RepID=A0ABW3MTU2_9MICO